MPKTVPAPICLGDIMLRRGFPGVIGIVVDKRDEWVSLAWDHESPRTHAKLCHERELVHATWEEAEKGDWNALLDRQWAPLFVNLPAPSDSDQWIITDGL